MRNIEYSEIDEKKNKNVLVAIIKAIFSGLLNIASLYTRENLDNTISVNIRLTKKK